MHLIAGNPRSIYHLLKGNDKSSYFNDKLFEDSVVESIFNIFTNFTTDVGST